MMVSSLLSVVLVKRMDGLGWRRVHELLGELSAIILLLVSMSMPVFFIFSSVAVLLRHEVVVDDWFWEEHQGDHDSGDDYKS